MEADAFAKEAKAEPVADEEDCGAVEQKKKDLATGDAAFGGAGRHIGEDAAAGEKVSDRHLYEDDDQDNEGRDDLGEEREAIGERAVERGFPAAYGEDAETGGEPKQDGDLHAALAQQADEPMRASR